MKALKSAPTSPSDPVVPLAASTLKEMPHRSVNRVVSLWIRFSKVQKAVR